MKKGKRLFCCLLAVGVMICVCACGQQTGDRENPQQNQLVSEEDLKRMEEEREATEIIIGLWEGPRKHAMTTQEEANQRYEEIKAAGINMVYLYAELQDEDWLEKSLCAAETVGVSVMIDLGGVYTDKTKFYRAVEQTKDSPAVIGYNIVDEPSYQNFNKIKTVAGLLREEISADKIILCNLLPNYAQNSALAAEAQDGKTFYQTYLDTFCATVPVNILHFDYYPYNLNPKGDPASIRNMVVNLVDIRNTAEKYGITIGGFLQSCRWGSYDDNGTWKGTRIPNEAEYRFIANLHLVFGAKTMTNFLYWSRNGSDPNQRVDGIFDGLITYEGEQTPVYGIVQKTNQAIHAMKGVYLSYTHDGFLTVGLPEDVEAVLKETLLLNSYDMVKEIESDGQILAGCFRDNGKKGLYIMNFERAGSEESQVTVKLEKTCTYQVWGAGGLEQAGSGSEITVSLLPGAGCFVELES